MRIFGEKPLTLHYLPKSHHTTIIFRSVSRGSLSRPSFYIQFFMETWPTAQEMSERAFFEWIIRLCGDRVGGCAFLLTSRVNYSVLWLQFSINCSTFGWSIDSRERKIFFVGRFHKGCAVVECIHGGDFLKVKSRRKSFADRQFDFETTESIEVFVFVTVSRRSKKKKEKRSCGSKKTTEKRNPFSHSLCRDR